MPAYTVDQPPEAMEVLRNRALEKKVNSSAYRNPATKSTSQASFFKVVPVRSDVKNIPLGLAGDHQQQNASLAVHLAHSYFTARPLETGAEPSTTRELDSLPETYIEGLKNARWPGRCQAVEDPTYSTSVWFLDGAHTTESLACCGEWFIAPGLGLNRGAKRVFIFNCTHGRNGMKLLGALLSSFQERMEANNSDATLDTFFDDVIFCTNVTYADGTFKGGAQIPGTHPP